MHKAACYCRVSTRKDDQLDSLDKQREFFARFFESNPEYTLYELYADEGISGKSLRNRREFQRMLKDAQEGRFDALFVKDVSRFARNVQDFYYALDLLDKHGVRVHFVTLNLKSEQASRFTLGLMALLAEDESQRLSVKVKFGKNVTARRGRVPNFVFGYDRPDAFTLVPNEQEAAWVRRIFSLYTNEGMGTARIAQWLNHMGIPTKRERIGSWTQSSVTKLLRNPLYTGLVVNLRSEVMDFKTGRRRKNPQDGWVRTRREAFRIIDEQTFQKAQELLSDRAQAFAQNRRQSSIHPLSNLLRCAQDGRSFRRIKRRERAYWACSYRNAHGAASCQNSWRIDEDQMHALLGDYLRSFVSSPPVQERILTRIQALLQASPDQDPQAELSALAEKTRRLCALYADGVLGRAELEQALSPIRFRQQELCAQQSIQKKSHISCMELRARVTLYIQDLGMTAALPNHFLKELFAYLQVDADGGVSAYFPGGQSALLARIRKGS